jgi:hypothetical protein
VRDGRKRWKESAGSVLISGNRRTGNRNFFGIRPLQPVRWEFQEGASTAGARLSTPTIPLGLGRDVEQENAAGRIVLDKMRITLANAGRESQNRPCSTIIADETADKEILERAVGRKLWLKEE